jgi:hypothetical protein
MTLIATVLADQAVVVTILAPYRAFVAHLAIQAAGVTFDTFFFASITPNGLFITILAPPLH